MGLLLLTAAPAAAQVEAEPILRGRVLLADSALPSGVVTLHLLSPDEEGELDSVRVGDAGSFSFRLPRVPDPERSELYFASVRHQGILYFGTPVTLPIQLDSVYTIQAYDTAVVRETGGTSLPLQVRNLFFEPDGDDWRVTDLIQVRNDGARTLVAAEGAAVWRYPLPAEATEPTLGQSDLIPGGSGFEDGALVVRSPIPPGERLFVVRYAVPSPFLTVPTPGVIETFDVLIREPAPALEAPGLDAAPGVELEPGTTYRRFTGVDWRNGTLALVEGTERRAPPVEWLGVMLAVVLTAVGLWAWLREHPSPATAPASGRPAPAPFAGGPADEDREALLLEVARLDEAFEALDHPDAEQREAYRRRRRDLLSRLS
ncbi:MAG: hypothetical protein RH859_12245 [Longimicrobiales bacterium]